MPIETEVQVHPTIINRRINFQKVADEFKKLQSMGHDKGNSGQQLNYERHRKLFLGGLTGFRSHR